MTVSILFQLKILWDEVQMCHVHVSQHCYFLLYFLLELCLIMNLGFLYTENITNGKQCKEKDAVMEMCVGQYPYVFSARAASW